MSTSGPLSSIKLSSSLCLTISFCSSQYLINLTRIESLAPEENVFVDRLRHVPASEQCQAWVAFSPSRALQRVGEGVDVYEVVETMVRMWR